MCQILTSELDPSIFIKILFNFNSLNKGKPSENPFNIAKNQELHHVTLNPYKTRIEQSVESNFCEKFKAIASLSILCPCLKFFIAWKMSTYGVFSGPYFPVFGWVRSDNPYSIRISPYSGRIRENTDQKKLRMWTLFTQCFSKRFLRKSIKSGHGNLVLIASTVQVELWKLNFNFDD